MAESANKGMQMQQLNDRDADLHKTYIPIKDRVFKDISVEGFDTCSLPTFGLKLALKKHFASCGKIVSIWVIKSVAFIRFEGEGAQEKALQLDGTDVAGWTAIVKPAVRPLVFDFSSDDNKTELFKLFVSGYDTGLAEIDIQIALCENFSSCGVIWGISVTPSGRAIITIGGEGCVEKALELSGRQVGEMNILVDTGKRQTEIPISRRLIDENACGYVLGTYSRLMAKRRKEEMVKEKKKEREMKREVKISDDGEEEGEGDEEGGEDEGEGEGSILGEEEPLWCL